MEVEDEGERFAPYFFDVRPRPLQHSRMVALSKRLTVCLRHDKGEFGLEWTPQAMTPLEKVLSLRIMQERGAKLGGGLPLGQEEVPFECHPGHPLHWSMSRAQHGGGGGPCVHQGRPFRGPLHHTCNVLRLLCLHTQDGHQTGWRQSLNARAHPLFAGPCLTTSFFPARC